MNVRKKGFRVERLYVKIFKNLGFSKCITSRLGSRLHDNSGIDLINLPFNVQIKAGKQRNLNYIEEIKKIKTQIKENFGENSETFNKPLILIHHKDAKQGVKRTEFDTKVILTFEDFVKLIKSIYETNN